VRYLSPLSVVALVGVIGVEAWAGLWLAALGAAAGLAVVSFGFGVTRGRAQGRTQGRMIGYMEARRGNGS
jgi:hypothetical protein